MKLVTTAFSVVLLVFAFLACRQREEIPMPVEPSSTNAPFTPERSSVELDTSRPERLKLTSGITGITERELPIEFSTSVEWDAVAEPKPDQRFLSPHTAIEGTWARYPGDDATVLIVTSEEHSLYRVEFETGGDLGGWKLSRLGKYENGVLTLNLPVREYSSREYRTLYAVRLLDNEYLVSSQAARELPRLESEMASSQWMEQMYLLSRQNE